jgi:hypothetical protein
MKWKQANDFNVDNTAVCNGGRCCVSLRIYI